MMASRTGNVEAMKVLLDRGAQVNAKETLRGTTALMWAADQGHTAAVKTPDRPRRRSECAVESGAEPEKRSSRKIGRSEKIEPGARRRVGGCDALKRSRGLRRGSRGRPSLRPRRHRRNRRISRPPPLVPPRPQPSTTTPRGRQELTGGGLTALTFAVARQFPRDREDAARRGRRYRSADGVRLDALLVGHPEPVLSARVVPPRPGRRPEQDQQGRLDAAVSRRG